MNIIQVSMAVGAVLGVSATSAINLYFWSKWLLLLTVPAGFILGLFVGCGLGWIYLSVFKTNKDKHADRT